MQCQFQQKYNYINNINKYTVIFLDICLYYLIYMGPSLFSKLFQFVMLITSRYNIDESHSLSHSMDVLHFAHNIYNSELPKNPDLAYQERIIYTSAILHDMCDKKYMDQTAGLQEIEKFLGNKMTPFEIDVSCKIMETMSYSTVKKDGFPDLGIYQPAYHIVRESDLLAAYDFDRSMIYHMHHTENDIDISFKNAKSLFKTRVLKHNEDELFVSPYAKTQSIYLHNKALIRMNTWERMLSKKTLV